MTTLTFETEQTAGAAVYARVWGLTGSELGQVFDFSDNAMKAFGSAVTPHILATEQAAMGGTTKSGFTVTIDLAELHPGASLAQYRVKWYIGTPAAGDESVDQEEPFFVRFGEPGIQEVRVEAEMSVTSRLGHAADISVWLTVGGKQVTALEAIDTDVAVSVTVREVGDVNQFTVTGDDTDLVDDAFELSKSDPNFVSDRQYKVIASIDIDGETFQTIHVRTVLG